MSVLSGNMLSFLIVLFLLLLPVKSNYDFECDIKAQDASTDAGMQRLSLAYLNVMRNRIGASFEMTRIMELKWNATLANQAKECIDSKNEKDFCEEIVDFGIPGVGDVSKIFDTLWKWMAIFSPNISYQSLRDTYHFMYDLTKEVGCSTHTSSNVSVLSCLFAPTYGCEKNVFIAGPGEPCSDCPKQECHKSLKDPCGKSIYYSHICAEDYTNPKENKNSDEDVCDLRIPNLETMYFDDEGNPKVIDRVEFSWRGGGKSVRVSKQRNLAIFFLIIIYSILSNS